MAPTQTNQMIEYRRLRAPARDGEAFVDPPWEAAAEIVEENAARLRHAEREVAGRPRTELAAEARRQLLKDARRYSAQYRNVDPPGEADRRVLLAGHQPQLFHPGVWFKNFALSAMGRRLNATTVNLVIDNDVAGAPSLRVPSGSPEAPRVEAIPFDAPAPRIPYEARPIVDRELFRDFGHRVEAALGSLVAAPLIARLWPYAIEAMSRTENLGRAISQARHRLEADYGLHTLELPLSRVCGTAPFAHFVASLLSDLPRFGELHNHLLHEYRRVHRLRSRKHPAPDLAADGEWREAPLWVWSDDDSARRRLFARRRRRDEVELTDRKAWTAILPLRESGDASEGVERLLRLEAEGIKVRTRALMTTLYARLFLGDLFLHGIGGAKYDQLTDALMQGFFGVAPPTFYTVTATVLLPVPRPEVTEDDVRRVEQQMRELRFHPEQHLDAPAPEAARLVAEKRRWIATEPAPGAGRARHQGIEHANLALQPWVEDTRRRLEQERREMVEALRKAKLLGSREFSFCLFPEDHLPALLQRVIRDLSPPT